MVRHAARVSAGTGDNRQAALFDRPLAEKAEGVIGAMYSRGQKLLRCWERGERDAAVALSAGPDLQL